MKLTKTIITILLVLLFSVLVLPGRKASAQDKKPGNQSAPASKPKLPIASPSPKPLAGLSSSAALGLMPVVNPPYPLYVSNNPQECAKHVPNVLFGGLICEGVLKAADTLPLMWSWQPCAGPGCVSQINGFHIYKVPKDAGYQNGNIVGPHTLVTSQTDPNFTVSGIKPFSQSDCFTVRAYKGNLVSSDSPRFCANEVVLGTATVTIGQQSGSLFKNNSSCGQDPGVVKFDPYAVKVGSQHFIGNGCNGEFDYEGVLFFDYSPYAQNYFISKATLTLSFNDQSSCATTLGDAAMDWRANNQYSWRKVQFISANQKIELPPALGNKVLVDMTEWVRNRVGYANGFTLTTTNDCLSAYSAELKITYFK